MTKAYYVNGWTEEEIKLLVEIMTDGIKAGYSVSDMLTLASDSLRRTRKATMNRWYAIRMDYLDKQ